jgi:uncharacterized protein (DUF305 family)
MTVPLKPYGGPNIPLIDSMSGMAGKVERARNPDLAFVQDMLPHHASAIDMAKLALGKPRDSRRIRLSNSVVAAQAGEMAAFQAWLSCL